ncbi:gliding motility-associated C-terminal domain-containing protein [Hymenobacter bucti]|uniref:Gliding motility-associated C-terminal domain-containing protein n=1 Tax=Hymenobacter bucti TaxID=1844114 RepID=A0ABW4QS31_9BACT
MKSTLRPILVLLGVLGTFVAQAQGPYATWYFGQQAGLRFGAAAGPVPLTDGQLTSPAACATLCTTAGDLLCYSNGQKIWNKQHQVMAGGDSLGGSTLASQGCGLLRAPNAGQTAYVLTMRYEGPISAFSTGQPVVTEVDLAGAGGLGQVGRRRQPVVADSILMRLGERKFAAHQALVRHANGTDYWLITRLQEQGIFLASRITGGGVWPCPVTVVSRVFAPRVSSAVNLGSTLAAAPNGQTLLYNDVATSFLLKFDPATGRVSAPTQLTLPAPAIPVTSSFTPYCYGAVFSPDGSKCYLSRHYQVEPVIGYTAASQVIQYNLAAGSPQAVAASGVEVSSQYARSGGVKSFGMQRGADGAIYVAVNGEAALDVIAAPNALGQACQYSIKRQQLANRLSGDDLPMITNDANLAVTLTLRDAYGCAGQPTLLVADGSAIGAAGDSLVWSPGGGLPVVRTTAAATPTVTYATPGTYPLMVALRRAGRTVLTATATAYIFASPTVSLGADTAVCTPFALRLAPRTAIPAGSALRWQDGSTEPALTATAPGTYWVEVTTSTSCTTRATIIISAKPTCPAVVVAPPAPLPVLIPNVLTPNGDGANEYFVLQGLVAADWKVQVFSRWGQPVFEQEKYDNRWAAQGQAAGLYYYLLRHAATGQQYRGWVEVIK